MLEIVNQNKQIFEPNSDFIDNYVNQIHQERNKYQDDNHSVENIDFAVEASYMQVHTIALIVVEAHSRLHQFKLMTMTYEKQYVR